MPPFKRKFISSNAETDESNTNNVDNESDDPLKIEVS